MTRFVSTHRVSNDKEFHFQNWVYDRIVEAGFSSSSVGRNTYPDFPIDSLEEAYEVKGITAGSRENDFDSNSALPAGRHHGSRVFYIFGRYESVSIGGEAPRVLDIVIVDGSFLNAGSAFLADNKSLRVLGAFGDILLRDRKMYAPYTPYRNISGLRGHCTLIVESGTRPPDDSFVEVGRFIRREAEKTLVGYRADLRENTLIGEFEDNPRGGYEHEYLAWRSAGGHSVEAVEWISR